MSQKRINLRKIIVGESFLNCIKYQKGSTYKLPIGNCILTDLVENKENPIMIDLYLSHNDSKFLWKSINTKMILEVEYDSNFE